jgi:hypothetical protein
MVNKGTKLKKTVLFLVVGILFIPLSQELFSLFDFGPLGGVYDVAHLPNSVSKNGSTVHTRKKKKNTSTRTLALTISWSG